MRTRSRVPVRTLLSSTLIVAVAACDPSPTALRPGALRAERSAAAPRVALPMRGTIEATEAPTSPNGDRLLTGTGEATHLGRYSIRSEFNVANMEGAGAGTLTAANGDRLAIACTGSGEFVDGKVRIVETCPITGGTGRFAGATGELVIRRLLTPGVPPVSSVGTIEGTIVFAR